MKKRKRSHLHKHLEDRHWSPVHTDLKDWRHPRLHYHWRTMDALKLENERDEGEEMAVRLLGTNAGD